VERFRGIVASRLGLVFEDSKVNFLANVMRGRLETLRRESGYYLSRLETVGDEEFGVLARELTIGETYFFRNIEQFRALTEIVVPERLRARGGERCLNVLSAGCSSGEEAYTLAILLREAVPGPDWTVSVRAVDLNPGVLERAASGRFSKWALRETPPEARERWFRPDGNEYVLDEDIRRAVTFERRNITAADPELWRPNHYDVIFCRNVIMYFSPEKMRAVVGHVAGSLVPGGYLFLGHAETLRGLSQDFSLLNSHDAFYYRTPKLGETVPSLPEFRSRTAPPAEPVAPAGPDIWFDTIGRSADRVRALGEAPVTVVPKLIASSPKWNLARVLDLLQLERFVEALDTLRALPPEASDCPEVLLLTAVLLANSGQLSAASEVAGRLLERDKLNAGAHYVLALGSESIGDNAAAASHDNFSVYLDPDFAMPRLHLGLLARRAGNPAAARRDLNQALLLLQREEASRILLFGGGFTREALIALCRAELNKTEAKP